VLRFITKKAKPNVRKLMEQKLAHGTHMFVQVSKRITFEKDMSCYI